MDSTSYPSRPFSIEKRVQDTLTGEVIAIMQADWLNTCKVNRLARSLDEVRLRYGFELPSVAASLEHIGIYAGADAVGKPSRAGIPTALLAVFGLNNRTGPVLLGENGWRQVEYCLACAASSAGSGAWPSRAWARLPSIARGLAVNCRARIRRSVWEARLAMGAWIIGNPPGEIAFVPKSAPSHSAHIEAHPEYDRSHSDALVDKAEDPVAPIKSLLASDADWRHYRPIPPTPPKPKDKLDIDGFADDDDDDDDAAVY